MASRVKEHLAACKYAYFCKSPIAEHAWQEGSHNINNEVDCSKNMVEKALPPPPPPPPPPQQKEVSQNSQEAKIQNKRLTPH